MTGHYMKDFLLPVMGKKARRAILVILSNLIIAIILFALLELAYRIRVDGFFNAFANIINYYSVPYSNLGTSNWVIYDAELGYRLNPKRLNINSRSVRHEEIVLPKPQGTYRIIVLGDSVPWDKDGFVDYVREQLNGLGRYEVINASVPGYTSYQELLFFKRYLFETNPDLVIWTYCLNDNYKFLHQFDEKARMLVTEEARKTLTIDSSGDFLISRSYILSWLRIKIMAKKQQEKENTGSRFVWETQTDFNIAWKDYSWRSYEDYLKEMLGLLAQKNTKLAVVVFPYEPQLDYRHDTSNYDYAVKPQRILNALCEKYRIRCLDMYPVFSPFYDKGQKLFRDGIHLNDHGHRVTAETIHEFLLKNQLVPPN